MQKIVRKKEFIGMLSKGTEVLIDDYEAADAILKVKIVESNI